MATNPDRTALARDLHRLLEHKPGQNKHQLHGALLSLGWQRITKSEINSVLYSYRNRFRHSDDVLPLWYPRSFAIDATPPLQAPQMLYYQGPELRAWQSEAFDAWRAAGRRGVVEAVTGTGKTAVGIVAAADAAARGLRTLVLAPGLELLDQWHRKLKDQLPRLAIGRFGDSAQDSLANHDIVVSTVQSACKWRMLPQGLRGLLVADEVHRYGAEKFALALKDSFEERLGLTATYERNDNGIQQFLSPYFVPLNRHANGEDEVIANCGYARGLADGILAPFEVTLVGVHFTPDEQREYDTVNAKTNQSRHKLIKLYGCPEEPFGEFMRSVSLLSEGSNGRPEATQEARRFLNAFRRRRQILAESQRKPTLLRHLAPEFESANGILVFTETKQSAEIAATELNKIGIAAASYTSALDREERRERLQRFKTGHIRALAAPRVLDEGVDVPEADVGVIIAASHSRRQMIQRMGRIIRPKDDGRSARFFVLYVKGTSEDPELGAHEAFLNDMMDNAEDIRCLELSRESRLTQKRCNTL
jgi:RNA polymerase primary sigma factor